MKYFLLALVMTISMQSFSQELYDVSKDAQNGSVVYKGEINFRDLTFENDFSSWMGATDKYKPDTASIAYLKQHLKDYNMVVFLGTWCDDSHIMIPKLYKVLQAAEYPLDHVRMYGVDRAKTSKGGEQLMYNIVNVPTIILYKKNRETGRIVEVTQKSVEADLKHIIQLDKAKQ